MNSYDLIVLGIMPEVTNGGLELRATPAKIRVQILTRLGNYSRNFWKPDDCYSMTFYVIP